MYTNLKIAKVPGREDMLFVSMWNHIHTQDRSFGDMPVRQALRTLEWAKGQQMEIEDKR